MKIALVTDSYYPRINGVAASTRTFAREFTNLGHTVHVHAPSFSNESNDQEPFRVIRYPSMYVPIDSEDRLGYPSLSLVKDFAAERYDVVHTQTPFTLGRLAAYWARKSDSLLVHTYHTLFTAYTEFYLWFLPQQATNWATKRLSRSYCDLCDLVVVPSLSMRRELASCKIKPPVHVIPTGIDISQFEGSDAARFRRKHGFAVDDVLLLFMGRLGDEKNIDFLFRVFKQILPTIPNSYLLIGGDGPAAQKLKNEVRRLGIYKRVLFLGYIEGADWRDCYAAATLFLFPSVTEAQGLVVIEAMAAGVPVVAIKRMGIRNIMAKQLGGYAVEPNENKFCQATLKLLLDKKLYQKKKQEALLEAQKWSSLEMAKRMIALYQKTPDKSVEI